MKRRMLYAAVLVAGLSDTAGAGVFIGASSTSFPTGVIAHPKGYSGSSTTAVVNKVCFNPATLPAGVTETQVDATISKAVATWNAQRYGTDNYLVGGNNDLGATQYDFESAVLHEIGHCVGLGHPTIATGVSGGTANATASRPDASNSYDLNDGADNIFGSRDDLRGDNTNLYWFYATSNDPLAYPSIIDTTTFTQATGSLPSGSTWPANANSNVTAALGYSSARASMTWDLAADEVRRRLTAEDLSTIKLGRAGRDGVAGNADDYSLQLSYDSSVSSCDITVSFTTATSFGQCSLNLGGLTGAHYVISSPTITFNPNPNWYFSPATNTTTTITSDSPDPSTVNNAYSVGVSVVRSALLTGTPTGSVLVSDGSVSCTAALSGSGSTATGSCSLTSTTTGTKTLTASYLGYQGFDASTDTESHTVSLPSASISVTDSPDPTAVGVSYTVAFTLSGSFGTPTGTVTVSDGSASCGPVTLSGGAGSCSLTSTTGGTKTLRASYSGDTNYAASSSTTPHTVSYLTPTLAITDTPDPTTPGASFTIGATVSGSGGTPTGVVTIEMSDGGGCSITLSGGTGSCSRSSSAVGTLTLTGTYEGNSVYDDVLTSVSHSVKYASTTTITSDSPDPSVVGQAYTVAFSVANTTQPATTPTGSVTVSDGSASCTGTLSSGSGSCLLTSTTRGSKSLTATYAGNTTVAGSTSSAAAHTVNAAATTTTISADTPDPSVTGQAVSVTFAVAATSPGSGTPSGTVTVSAAGGSETCSVTLPATSCTITLTSAGSRALTATFASSNSNFSGSTSSSVAHTVNAAATTTTISADTPDPSVTGQAVSVTFAVAVTSPGSGTPSGTVTIAAAGGSETCSAALPATSCTITLASAGSRALTATFASSNGNFSGSTSSSVAHAVNAAATTTSISADAPDPSLVGQAVAVTFAVATASPGSGTPSGTVTIAAADGSETCSAALPATSCIITLTAAGSRALTATFASSSANFGGSTSAAEPHTVNRRSTSIAIIGDSPDPSVPGDAYTVAVSVAEASPDGLASSLQPTGTVSVGDGTASCTMTLSNAQGSCMLTGAVSGDVTLTASYGGDGEFAPATATEAHTVARAAPIVSIVSHAPNPSDLLQSYEASVSVSGSVGTPGGTVTVYDGSPADEDTATCTVTLVDGGGSCSLASAIGGTRTLRAVYGGDVRYDEASATADHDVNRGSVTMDFVSTPNPSAVGESYWVAVTFARPAGAEPVSGSVTIGDGATSCTSSVVAATGGCALTGTAAGEVTLTVDYGGSVTYLPATTSATHTVQRHATTTSIVSDAPDPSVVGTAYLVTVEVAATPAPGGAVTVGDGVTSCIATLTAGGGSCTLTATGEGERTLTATFAETATHAASAGTALHTAVVSDRIFAGRFQ